MSEHEFDQRGSGRAGPGTEMEAVAEASHTVNEARLERLEAVAAIVATGGFSYDGFTSATSFLVARCGLGVGEAHREVFLARSLEHMPYAVKLVRAGELTVSQLEVLARARTRHPDAFATDEPTLAESVGGLTRGDTRRAVDYWCQAHDNPNPTDPPPRSRVYLSRTWRHRGRLDGDLDPEDSTTLAAALDALISEAVRATPAADLPAMSELRAEALAELARRFLDALGTPVDHGNRPHLTVVVGWRTLTGEDPGGTCELTDGTVITPAAARRLACDARVCRMLLGPDSEILDLGRTRRTVSPAQWRALRVRDRHCQFEGCRRPWHWCDAHHLIPSTSDGETNLSDLVLMCRFHHTLVHEGGWTVAGTAGQLTFTRPDGTILAHAPP